MKRLALLLSLFVSLPALAQNSRGSINGQVTDPSGAILPHITVTVTNTDTGAVSHVATTSDGYYSAQGLMPGPYEVTVDTKGFKTFTQSGIQLATQENATVNIKLTVGSPTETVTVTSNAPLIDEEDASVGQVLSTEEVQDLPSDGRSPLGFARIEYGAVAKAKHALGGALPYDNSTVDDFSLGGGNSSSNELLLNGVPNMQDSGRTAGFSPVLDSVNEVRVDSFGANTTYGDTSGGTVNITTKSGTNSFHGSGFWFYQAAGCSGLDGKFVSRAANHCDFMSALPWATNVGSTPPNPTHLNQYGGTLGGPVWIPHVFDGHNKLFFFYAYEGDVGAQPPTATIGTVPTQAERNGDFTALLGLSNGNNYQLYNPYTAAGSQTSYTRSQIPNDCLVATCGSYTGAGLTLSPVAQAYLKYVPLPTPGYNGPTTTPDGQNNYFTFTPRTSDYRSHDGRIDFNLSSRDKMWGEAHRSRYITTASNYFHNSSTGTKSDQIESGGLVEEVHTFSPTLLLDVRGSVTRHDLTNFISSSGINPTSLGFPGYIAANSTAIAMPQITFSDQSSPLGLSGSPGSSENFDTIQLFATLTKVYRSHTFMGGADIRAYKDSVLSPGNANGGFSFSNGIVSPGSSGSGPYFGGAFAAFLLGIPSGGSYNIAAPFQFNSFLNGFFLQDNWKAKPNLTISYGLRFEHETPVVESQNRMVNGFNPTAVNEATLAAQANYAAHPSPLLATSAFQPTGGAIYAATPASPTRAAYNNPPLYVSPRFGISWAPAALHEKAVVRIGYGIYDNPFNDYNQGQSYGYSQSTSYVSSINSTFTFNTLSDPFPTSATAPAPNPILQPTGNALGLNTNLGNKMVYYYPNLKVPYAERASLDLQYQIGKTILLEVGYMNTHQVHLSYSNAVDAIPLLPYLSRSPYFDLAVNNELSGTTFKTGGPPTTDIANPFRGVAGITGGYASATLLTPAQYLMSTPEFTSVTEQLIPGSSSNYNALNVRAAKMMGHGLTLNGIFEWSRQLGTFNQLNAGDVLNYGETTSDYPFHFAGYGTYQLPFGHGRQFFNSNRYINPVIGGWQVSAIYQFVSGQPIQWGNAIYIGNGWKDFHNVQHSSANVFGTPVFNTAVFDTRTCVTGTSCQNDPSKPGFNESIQPNAYNYRTFPAYLLRQDYTSNWDANVQKDTQLAEGISLELRIEAFNLLNRPEYTNPNVSPTSPNFGKTNNVAAGTLARQLQVGAHIRF